MFFGLYSKLIAAAMVAALLAGIYWRGHTQGYKARDVIAQADIAKRTAEALEASEKARQVEQELNRKVRNVQDAYRAARANTDHVAAAAAVGMRELEAILAKPSEPASSASATGRADGTGGLERELLGSCAKALTAMGQAADRLEAKVVGLQSYVADVCVAK